MDGVVVFILLLTAAFWVVVQLVNIWKQEQDRRINLLAQIRLGIYQVTIGDVLSRQNRAICVELSRAFLAQATTEHDYHERLFELALYSIRY